MSEVPAEGMYGVSGVLFPAVFKRVPAFLKRFSSEYLDSSYAGRWGREVALAQHPVQPIWICEGWKARERASRRRYAVMRAVLRAPRRERLCRARKLKVGRRR